MTNLIPRDQVAERFHVSATLLKRYEDRGLVHATRHGDAEGYDPAEVPRVWSVVSLHRDLGINLAGVEAILRMKSRLDEVHSQLSDLAHRMSKALERDPDHAP